MTDERRRASTGTALLVACAVAALFYGCAEQGETLAIRSTTLIDGRTGSPLEDITIVVRDGRIESIGKTDNVAIPGTAQIIDGSKSWVTPGFIDVHVHTDEADYLRKMLALGVTSAHLMPSSPPDSPASFQDRSQRSDAPTPRAQVSWMFSGGWPDNVWPEAFELLKPENEVAARQAVRDLNSRGFLQIKIIQDDSRFWVNPGHRSPRLALPVFEALVDEAHELGMRVYVHAPQEVDTRAAIDADVDAFMHGTMDAVLEPSLWQQMKAKEIVWTPTFAVVTDFGDYREYARRILSDEDLTATLTEEELAQYKTNAAAETPIWDSRFTIITEELEERLEYLRENTRRARDLGIPIAVGSDGGPGGVGLHLEMEFLQEAGLTPSQVIVAATHGGARALGISNEVGTVELGNRADLVVLNANPLSDVRNARKIAWVIKGGTLFDPRELARRTTR
jgi:imidazolonepropionase-like amidohydrolase